MNDQKQLIKAIANLTKALNKNTEAIRENSKLNEPQIEYVESGTPDEPILLTPDKVAELVNKGGVFVNDGIYSGSWGKGFRDNPIVDDEVLTTDGLGNSHDYKKGVGGILYSGNENIGKTEFITTTGEITLTEEDQKRLFDSLKDKGKKFK